MPIVADETGSRRSQKGRPRMSVSGISSTSRITPRARKTIFSGSNSCSSNWGRIFSLAIYLRRSRTLLRCSSSCRKAVRLRRAAVPSRRPSASWSRIFNRATFRRRSRITRLFSRTSRVRQRRARRRQRKASIIITGAADRVKSGSYWINWERRCNPGTSLRRKAHSPRCSRR